MSVALVRKHGLFIFTLVHQRKKRDLTESKGVAIHRPFTPSTLYHAVLAGVILIEHILE